MHAKKDVRLLKLLDPANGTTFEVAFDAQGRVLDPNDLRRTEHRKRYKAMGALSDQAFGLASAAPPGQGIPVWIFARMPGGPPDGAASAAALADAHTRVTVAVAAVGGSVVAAFPDAPIVRATVRPGGLVLLARDREVSAIVPAPQRGFPTSEVWKEAIGLDHVYGYGGQGQRVAVEMEFKPDSYANLDIRYTLFADHLEDRVESTVAAGILKTKVGETRTGIVPQATVDFANADLTGYQGTDFDTAESWIRANGVRIVAYGWSAADGSGTSMNGQDMYLDWLARQWPYPLFVASAGNRNGPEAEDFPPCQPDPAWHHVQNHGYNSLIVGGTTADGTAMYECSSYLDPASPHGDRELPHLVAPAKDLTAGGATADGTSGAAAIVAGIAALAVEANLATTPPAPDLLVEQPEALRAILMASAGRDVDPGGPEKDGAGLVSAAEAVELARAGRWVPADGPAERGFDFGTMTFATNFVAGQYDTYSTVYEVRVPPGATLKAALAWGASATCATTVNDEYDFCSGDVPDADLDLWLREDGVFRQLSGSWDNTHEALAWTNTNLCETYDLQLEVTLYSHVAQTTRFGLAWSAPTPDYVTMLGGCQAPGVCAAGPATTACVLGVRQCDYSANPEYEAVEISCDDLDNDCDGTTDEWFSWMGALPGEPCDGTGECGPGEVECADASWATCSTNPDGSAPEDEDEACNGLDDDCDGATDEGIPPLACGVGTCARTVVSPCVGGVMQGCVPGAPGVETCNGIDDDCDGVTDEGYAVGAACDGPDADLCQRGTYTCGPSGEVECVNENPANIVERCNGADDDCDGSTDEAYPEKGTACDGGDPDLCASGTWQCTYDGLGLECAGDENVPETCNGVDDDCDGDVDEGFNSLGDPCFVGIGACRRDGVVVCNVTGTGTMCSVMSGGAPADEVCGNHVDDDCDGETDEGFVEVCNGEDDDCDGMTDEGLMRDWCRDQDGDGFGDAGAMDWECAAPPGYVEDCTDCDDAHASAHPGAAEVCSGGEMWEAVDEDCDGWRDEGVRNDCGGCDDPATGADDLANPPGTRCGATGAGVYQCSEGTTVCVETADTKGYLSGLVLMSMWRTAVPAAGVKVVACRITNDGCVDARTAETNPGGRFFLPVPDYGAYRLHYTHRQDDAPWFVDAYREALLEASMSTAPTVHIQPFDWDPEEERAHVTRIAPTCPPDDPDCQACAQGSPEEDCTAANRNEEVQLYFPPAAVTGTMNLVLTRFDHGWTLPGPLPPTSHFTYAVDLRDLGASLAGDVHRDFEGTWPQDQDQWPRLRVLNTRGFPVGTVIPVGWYDTDERRWVPMDHPATVVANGGQTWVEWRVPHFSAFDLNLPAVPLPDRGQTLDDSDEDNGHPSAGPPGGPGGPYSSGPPSGGDQDDTDGCQDSGGGGGGGGGGRRRKWCRRRRRWRRWGAGGGRNGVAGGRSGLRGPRLDVEWPLRSAR